MPAARFIRNSLLAAALLLGTAGAIDYAVDPFQQYRVPSFYAPRFYRAARAGPGVVRAENEAERIDEKQSRIGHLAHHTIGRLSGVA